MQVTTFAGSGSGTYGDGRGTNAHFYNPTSITYDDEGNAITCNTRMKVIEARPGFSALDREAVAVARARWLRRHQPEMYELHVSYAAREAERRACVAERAAVRDSCAEVARVSRLHLAAAQQHARPTQWISCLLQDVGLRGELERLDTEALIDIILLQGAEAAYGAAHSDEADHAGPEEEEVPPETPMAASQWSTGATQAVASQSNLADVEEEEEVE